MAGETKSHRLFEALNSDKLREAEDLLLHGANPNSVLPVEGVAPMHIAAGLGMEAAKLLLRYGGDPNVRSVEGTTPMHVAATWGDLECLHILLLNGGDPFSRDQDDCNVMDHARMYGHADCTRLLQFYSLLLCTDTDSSSNPKIIYKCRENCDELHSERTVKPLLDPDKLNKKQTSDSLYLNDYIDWAFRQEDAFTDHINQHLSKYLSGQRKYSCDVTSPDHPYLEQKNRWSYGTTDTNDLGFQEFSRHVHWADELDKTLPLLDLQDTTHSSSQTDDTFVSCVSQSSSDKNAANICLATPKQIPITSQSSLEQTPVNTTVQSSCSSKASSEETCLTSVSSTLTPASHSSQHSSEHTLTNVCHRGQQKQGRNPITDENTCSNCEQLRKVDSHANSPVHNHSKQLKSDEKVKNWLNSSTPTDKLSSCMRRLSLQEERKDKKWHPPSLLEVQNNSDLISLDESFFERHRRSDNFTKMSTLSENVDDSVTLSLDDTLPYDYEQVLSSRDLLNESFTCASTDSALNETVEYVYSDLEEGVELVEKRLPSLCGSTCSGRRSVDSANTTLTVDSQSTQLYDWRSLCGKQSVSKDNGEPSQEIPQRLQSLSNDEVRTKLQKLGDDPGPVTPATRQTYLVRLQRVEKEPHLALTSEHPGYPVDLKLALEGKFDYSGPADLENKMVAEFQNTAKNRRWREGTIKSSFNYLLLDPRITKNLPNRVNTLSELETLKMFVSAIFYVGKGKRARPYCHLYEAINQLKTPKSKVSDKVEHILDIWGSGQGVVSLHCFQSVIPVEAYTREACMVDAIGLSNLTNKKRGDYYGIASTWTIRERCKVGVSLLKKALQIFLGEGERQIAPLDIKVGQ